MWNQDNTAFNLTTFPSAGGTKQNVRAHQRTRRHFRIPLTSLNTVQKEAFRCPVKQKTRSNSLVC